MTNPINPVSSSTAYSAARDSLFGNSTFQDRKEGGREMEKQGQLFDSYDPKDSRSAYDSRELERKAIIHQASEALRNATPEALRAVFRGVGRLD